MTQNQNALRNRSLRLCQLISDSKAENNFAEIRKLLEQGVDIDIQDLSRDDNTPLHLAVKKSDKNCVEILLSHKPDLLIKNGLNETPLDSTTCNEIRGLLLAARFDFVHNEVVQEIALENISKERLDILIKCSLVKVLKVTNCQSLQFAWETLRRHDLMSAIALSSHLFIIVIETQEMEINSSTLAMPFVIQRPMIVQVISVSSKQTSIYFKEENSMLLRKLEPNISIDEDEFMEKIHSEDDCNFALLVQGLQANIFGTLNGSLLDAKMDNDTRRSTFVNYFARTNALCHRFFKLFHENLTEKELNDRVLATLRFKGDQSLLALLDLPFTFENGDDIKLTDEQNRILSAENSRKYNLPMLAVELNNIEAVNVLIRCGADLSHCGADKQFASDICWDDENWECLAQLIEAGSPYPENFDASLPSLATSTFSGKITASIEASAAFHGNVKLGKIAEIKDFVDNNCKLMQVYDTSNKSALTVALESNQIEVYSLLLSKGFTPGADNGYDEVFKNFIAKNEIRNMHRKYFKKAFDEPHLKRLLDKYRLSFGSLNRDNCSRIIQEMFLKLNEIPEMVTILMIVSTSEPLKLVFDFNSRSVTSMDPTADSLTDGRTYHNDGFLYVSAENYLEGFFDVMGTLAHELCHYAMQLTYRNNCKPYASDDQTSEKAFEDIALATQQFCLEHSSTDSIISDVFKYPVNLWLRELIVRVPHLLARYKIEAKTLQAIKRQNYRLFDFFSTKVLKDIEKQSTILTQQLEINKINRKTGTISKIKEYKICFEKLLEIEFKDQIITSTVPPFTMAMLIQSLESNSTIFVGIGQILRMIERINKLSSDFKVVVDCFEMVEKYSETICKIRQLIKKAGVLILVMAEKESLIVKEKVSDFKVTPLVHTWSDLESDFQEGLLLKRVNFQGVPMYLKDLVDASSEAVKKIPPNQFLNSDPILIGDILPSPLNKLFVARSFIIRHFIDGSTFAAAVCTTNIHHKMKKRRNSFNSRMRAHEKKRESEKFVTSVKTLKELLSYAKRSTAVIISDSAGSGKTHTLHEIARTLREENRYRWTLLVDLKQHTEILKTCKTESFDDFVTHNILTNKSAFEKELFSQLYKDGRTNILLDGYDEISPYFKKEVLEALKVFLTESRNQLWITSRNYLANELEETLAQLSCSLQPLSKEVQIDFLRESWQTSAIRNEPNSSEDLSIIATSLINRLSSISHSNAAFTGSPILISMIAEIYDDSYKRTNLMQSETLSSYFIYDQFIRRNIKIWMSKGKAYEIEQEEINLQADGILAVHQKVALAHFFNNSEADTNYDDQDWNAEKLSRLGLLQYEISNERLSFVHETFAEYFIANFIIQNLKGKSKFRGVLELFVKVVCGKQFQFVRLFFNQALKEIKFQPDFYKTAGLHLSSILKEGNTFEVLVNISTEVCENLFIFTLDIVCHSEEEILEKLLQAKNQAGDSILHIVVQSYKNSTVQALLDVIGKLGLEQVVVVLLQMRGCKGRNIFHSTSFNQDFQIVKTLTRFAAKILLTEDIKNMLKEKDVDGWNMLHYAAASTNVNSLADLIKFLREVFSVEEIKELIFEADSQLLGPIDPGCPMFGPPTIGEAFRRLGRKAPNFLSAPGLRISRDGRIDQGQQDSFLHIAVLQSNKTSLMSHFKGIVEILGVEEIKKLLRQRGYLGRNILHHSCCNKNEDIISTTLEVIKLWLTKDEIVEMLNEKGSDGNNVCHVATGSDGWEGWDGCHVTAKSNALIDLLKALKMVEINTEEIMYETDLGSYNFLHKALMRYSKEAIKLLFDLIGELFGIEETKVLLQQNAVHDSNIFDVISRNSNKGMFSLLFECTSKILTREEIKPMLCRVLIDKYDRYLWRIIHCDVALDDDMALEDLVKILKDIFTKEEIKKFVFKIDQFGKSDSAVGDSGKWTTSTMFAFSEKLLGVDETKKLLRQRTVDGLNTLHVASCNDRRNVFSTVLECTQKLLHKNEFKDMILERSQKGKNLLHYIAILRDDRISNESQAVLFTAMESFLSGTEIKDFILQTTDHGSNCFLLASEKRNEKFIKSLFNFCKRFLNFKEQRTLLQKFDSDGDNIFTCAVLNSSTKVVSALFKYSHEILSDLEIKHLLQFFIRDRSVILNLSKNPNEKVLHNLFKYLKKYLNEDELKTLISHTDGSMSNIFHLVAKELKRDNDVLNRILGNNKYNRMKFFDSVLLILKNDLKFSVSNIKGFLTSCDNENKTVIQLAFANRSLSVQKGFWAILKNIFGFDDLVDLLQSVSLAASGNALEISHSNYGTEEKSSILQIVDLFFEICEMFETQDKNSKTQKIVKSNGVVTVSYS